MNLSNKFSKKIVLFLLFLFTWVQFFWTTYADDLFLQWEVTQPYCQNEDDCSIEKWIDIVDNEINDIEKNKKFSDKVQEISLYIISFIAIIWVLYIIYAWFTILTSAWDDSKVKKSKTTIGYVLIWILLIVLAYPIIWWIIKLVNSPTAFENPLWITRTYAYTINDKNTFDEYKKKIELLTWDLQRDYKVNGKISLTSLNELQKLVAASIDTFPDDNEFVFNTNLAKNLLISIDVVKKSPDSDSKITELAKTLSDFLSKLRLPRIKATITATPKSWSAPLTVSLRANNVVDPSWVLIPQWNYIWWIKQSDGSRKTLWTWPSISYTFREEKTYIVNLDISSASRNDKNKTDVLPFSSTIQVDVLPSAGNIYFYINWINVSELEKFKITPSIWKAWLLLDATASQTSAWSRFSRTMWDFGNGNNASYELGPRMEKQFYSAEWVYKLALKIDTNEWKQIEKVLQLEVRDPVATIKADKIAWFVWDDFKFNVNSYFDTWRLSYEWKIISLQWDETLFTSNKENISFKFRRTGKFAVKLKSLSPSWREDTDTIVINIESRDPIADFALNEASTETPNVFKIDATNSFDPDTFDSSKLKFSWYIDWQKVDLENPLRWWAMGKYTFNSIGTHKVVLEVSNEDGKTTTVKKDIKINSLLSIKLQFSPKIAKMGSAISIIADSKNASVFEWNFWDWSSDTTNVWRISHVYKKSWTYDLNLTVRWKTSTDWSSATNTITRKIYVSDWISPFANITMKRDNEEVIISSDACSWQDAYLLDRAWVVTFSAQDSVNTDGSTTWLIYSWKYMNKVSSQSQFTYKFDELGCFPVILTVKSTKTWKIHTTRSFVKIDNLAPKVSWLNIAASDINTDPVVVKVTANNPRDDDGAIVSYLWYYYTDSDPEPQDYRVTRTPSTTFVIPKVTWKYYFVLIAEDSNWAKLDTSKVTDEKYSIQLSTDNINTPIITLKADKTAISTWDEINFDISVSDILWRDISNKVEYKYDFDGDWFYDETSKSWKITHKFNTPWNNNFKVKVSYKWISNTKYQLISVKNSLKPNFEYYSIGKKIVLFNTSQWLYTSALWDLGNNITSNNIDSFVYDFSDWEFPKSVNLKIGDWQTFDNIEIPVKKDVLNQTRLSRSSQKLIIFSYPIIDDWIINIDNPSQKVFFYLGESKWKITSYCIDSDLSIDSDLNWTPDDDCDNKWTDSYTAWSIYVLKDFEKNKKSQEVRVSVFDWNNLIEKNNIKLVFDYNKDSKTTEEVKDNKEISENDRVKIEELKDLIKKSPENLRLQLTKFLSLLQENWFDDREKTRTIIDFESFVNSSSIDSSIKDQFYNTLESFLLNQSQAKDEIALAAKVLKTLIPKSNPSYKKIIENIDEILSHPTNTKLNKELWTFILNAIKDDSDIPNNDKLLIKDQIQVIIYWSSKEVPQTNNSTENSWWASSILWFLWWVAKVFGVIIVLFILALTWLFILFRLKNKNDNLSFQDFLIDLFFQQWEKKHIENLDVKLETSKKEDVLNTISTQPIVEELKKDEIITDEKLPFSSDRDNITEKDFLWNTSNPIPWVSSVPSGLPDWLKWVSSNNNETDFIQSNNDKIETTEVKEEVNEDFDLVNWNENEVVEKWNNEIEENNVSIELKNEIEDNSTNEELINKDEEVFLKDEEKNDTINTSESSLPDWLVSMNKQDNSETEAQKIEESTKNLSDEVPVFEIEENKVEEIVEENKTSQDWLPDWLKWIEPTNESSDDDFLSDEIIKDEFLLNNEETIKEHKEEKKLKKDTSKKTNWNSSLQKNKDQVKNFPTKSSKKEEKLLWSDNDNLPDWLK